MRTSPTTPAYAELLASTLQERVQDARPAG